MLGILAFSTGCWGGVESDPKGGGGAPPWWATGGGLATGGYFSTGGYFATGGSSSGGGPAATGGGAGSTNACTFETELTTRPGPCAQQQKECDGPKTVGCGSCPGDESCFGSRCYDALGAVPDLHSNYLLRRAIHAEAEGTRCTVKNDGNLERVEVALWNSNVPDITMEVYLPCGSQTQKAAAVTMPASAFPSYAGIHGVQRTTTFVLDPPLRVRAGDFVDVTFYAYDSDGPSKTAVAGIQTANVDPNCAAISRDPYFGVIQVNTDWDFIARLYVHP